MTFSNITPPPPLLILSSKDKCEYQAKKKKIRNL